MAMHRFHHKLQQRLPLRSRLRGLSIMEFMIAITIGIVLMFGVLLLMSRTSRSYKINDEFARMQENGSSAVRYLGDDIRMAGFYGQAGDAGAINTFDNIPPPGGDGFIDYGQDAGINFGTTAAIDCGYANWSLTPITPVWGMPPTTTPAQANTALPCIPAANYVTGPAIVLRGALGTMINRDANGNPQNWTSAQLDANTLYIQSDPGTGFIFQGSKYDAYKAATYTRNVPKNGGGFVDAPIYQYQSRIYYVRPCSRPSGAVDARGNPTCQVGDDGGNPIPTLVRQEWQSSAAGPILRETSLVEGVEKMSVVYGLDTLNGLTPVTPGCNYRGGAGCTVAPDGVADFYTATPPPVADPPPAVPNLNWQMVVTVRLNFLVRATAATAGYDDSVKTYDLSGGVTFKCTTAGAPCNYHRHLFSEVVQVKNISGRRGS
jgi:type IV pilus assembly protein PilW